MQSVQERVSCYYSETEVSATSPRRYQQSPQRKSITHGRSFVYDKGLASDSDKKVLTILNEQLTLVSLSYKNKINEMFQNLYQRRARGKHVQTEHKKWKKELEELWKKMIGDEAISHNQYPYIPLIENPKNQVTALSAMMRLEVQRHTLKRTTKELLLLLGSDTHKQTLKFYKEKIKECEAIIHKPTTEEKVDGLLLLLTKIRDNYTKTIQQLERQPNIVAKETITLFKELFEFILYTASNFETTLTFDEKNRISSIKEQATRELKALNQSPRANHVGQETTTTAVSAFIKAAQKRTLAPEDDFRNGMWLATTPVVGIYKEINAQVDKLRDIAKALSLVVETLQTRTSAILKGDTKKTFKFSSTKEEQTYYNTIICGLEEQIELQRQALMQLPISEKVHAGLYYVAKQTAKANEARMHMVQFERIASGKLHPYAIAFGHLFEYLDPIKQGICPLGSLYQAIVSACSLRNPEDMTTQSSFTKALCIKADGAISDTLALAAMRTLSHTTAELELPRKIFARISLQHLRAAGETQDSLPQICRSLLVKGFLKQEHFTKKETTVDPEFETLLYILTHDRTYTHSFRKTLFDDEDFRLLHDTYTKYSDLQKHPESLSMMAEILTTLYRPIQEEISIARQRYYKVQYMLLELQEQSKTCSSLQHAKRLSWIADKAKEPFKQLQETLKTPPHLQLQESFQIPRLSLTPSPQLIYKLLVVSTFASQKQTRLEATQYLLANTTAQELQEQIQDPHFTPLFSRWALCYFMDNSAIAAAIHNDLLKALFVEYLSNPDKRHFWQSQYGIEAMELSLVEFCSIDPSLYDVLKRKRGTAHLELYQAVSYLYKECSDVNVSTCLEKASIHFAQSRQQTDGPYEDMSCHLSLARWLVYQMRLKLRGHHEIRLYNAHSN